MRHAAAAIRQARPLIGLAPWVVGSRTEPDDEGGELNSLSRGGDPNNA
jgi:hypothetical protein